MPRSCPLAAELGSFAGSAESKCQAHVEKCNMDTFKFLQRQNQEPCFLIRQGLHFQLFNNLSIQPRRSFDWMLVGYFHISLMSPISIGFDTRSLTVGNIVTGDDMQTQQYRNIKIIEKMMSSFEVLSINLTSGGVLSEDDSHSKASYNKQHHSYVIPQVGAGEVYHQPSGFALSFELVECLWLVGIIGPLVNLLQNAEFDIKKESAWAISNATSGGSHEYLVTQGCIKPLCDLLICPDPRIVTVCLEGLENILKVGEAEKNLGRTSDVNLYAQLIDDAEGLEKIENLQSHDNQEIYEKAVKILETGWKKMMRQCHPGCTQQWLSSGGGNASVPLWGFSFN
ncbi:Importin alpha subunit (Karyopherin alpha subunit) (Serine-rich RNA polymerase I suppressor protein) [Datura stramonium]|uniref:Importin alpha subunit (Karyopherin alpha subunit) (Serine-rich RNA polymerase I suppressor protein) n=1 Tax=Datura stramonium TaxID=4076 RepID=A0ABS8TIH2_DATST|nr:Importin alpha subunit (Karyopherin alpha subunit) (Serine-rich RNA polymerase I suppressor protein) [Datura stramonium]